MTRRDGGEARGETSYNGAEEELSIIGYAHTVESQRAAGVCENHSGLTGRHPLQVPTAVLAELTVALLPGGTLEIAAL